MIHLTKQLFLYLRSRRLGFRDLTSLSGSSKEVNLIEENTDQAGEISHQLLRCKISDLKKVYKDWEITVTSEEESFSLSISDIGVGKRFEQGTSSVIYFTK